MVISKELNKILNTDIKLLKFIQNIKHYENVDIDIFDDNIVDITFNNTKPTVIMAINTAMNEYGFFIETITDNCVRLSI